MKAEDLKARVRHFTVPTLWDAVSSIVETTLTELGYGIDASGNLVPPPRSAAWEPPGGLVRQPKHYRNGRRARK